MHDARLALVEGDSSLCQPRRQSLLGRFGLLAAVAQHNEIVRVDHRYWSAGDGFHRAAVGVRAVAGPGSLADPVQRDVEEQGAGHPSLGSSLLGRGEPLAVEHARLQPFPDEALGGERAELAEDVVVRDQVEGRHDILPTSMASRSGCGSCESVTHGRAARLS